MKPVPLVKNLLLLVGTAILLFTVAEGVTRLVDPRTPFEGEDDPVWSIHRRSSDPILVYEPRPGAESQRPRTWDPARSVTYRINSLGLRDLDGLSPEKPRGRRRVLCLGDSVTFGLEVDLEETLVKRLEAHLLSDRPRRRDVECLNLGVSGYSPLQEVEFLRRRGLPLAPDLVLLLYNLNDTVDFSGELGYFYRGGHQDRLLPLGSYLLEYLFSRSRFLGWLAWRLERRRTEQETESHLGRLVEQARRERVAETLGREGQATPGGQPPLPGIPTQGLAASRDWSWVHASHRDRESWSRVRAALVELAEISHREGLPAAVVILPLFVDEQPYPFLDVHRFVAAEAAGLGLLTFDLLPALEAAGPLGSLSFDSIHPNTAGHEAIARALAVWLEAERLLERE